MKIRPLLVACWLVPASLSAGPIAFTWPTPNDAFLRGASAESILQQAGSGDPASGGFGCVRTEGTQFHEGIDIKALRRDAAGEPTDDIFAAMDGVVRYVNDRPAASSYGRYIVIEHPDLTPAVYTLYAHLSRVAPGIRAGVAVRRGAVIAKMGHTAGGYVIPKDRAHLHFEIGLLITRNFQAWYNGRHFDSPNEHGIYNGLNLMGFDPLDFLRQWKDGAVANFADYFSGMEEMVRVRIASPRIPDFARRYPSLLTRPIPNDLAGWEIGVNATGLPIALNPLTASELKGLGPNRAVIVAGNAEELARQHCRSLAVVQAGRWTIGSDLKTVLQQLFDLQ